MYREDRTEPSRVARPDTDSVTALLCVSNCMMDDICIADLSIIDTAGATVMPATKALVPSTTSLRAMLAPEFLSVVLSSRFVLSMVTSSVSVMIFQAILVQGVSGAPALLQTGCMDVHQTTQNILLGSIAHLSLIRPSMAMLRRQETWEEISEVHPGLGCRVVV